MTITVETTVNAPMAEVWRAYTTPEDILLWNAASDDWHTTYATVDLCEGGAFCFHMEAKDGSVGFDFAGLYTRVIHEDLIEYLFADRKVLVTFTETPDGIRVGVTFDPETTHSEEQQRAGWQAILDNFCRHTESLAG